MENSNLFGITYEEWKKTIKNYMNLGINYMQNHIYSYPLSQLSWQDRNWLLSEDFFNSYIASGMFLNDDELKKYNTIDPKNNGDFRNITLTSPIVYLLFLTIGEHFAKHVESGDERDWVNYAGNYNEGIMSYAKPYKDFSMAVLGLQKNYKYYLKADITSFYSTLNMGLLFSEIQATYEEESARSLMFYRKFLEYFGDGKYPTICDNVGLSFISTKIYLKRFDELLITRLESDRLIKNFQLIRYVDDLYIAFNCNNATYNHVIDHIKRYLQEVASQTKLKLNFQKLKESETKDISDDVYANIYDYLVNDENINYSERFNEDQIIDLLNKLLKLPEYSSHEIVEKTIEDVLDDHKYNFYYTEVINWYIYRNKKIFQNKEIIELLNRLVKRIDVIEQYPKQFGRMIINTRDDSLIKKYLNEIFKLFRTKPTPKFIEFLAKEYLLAHHFEHLDLKKYIKKNSPELYRYIKRYCEESYKVPRPERYKNKWLNNMENDPILHYLWFMSRCAKNDSEIMEEFAYYKNYFDRKFAYYMAAMGDKKAVKKGKVSFQSSYKINNVRDILKKWQKQGLECKESEITELENIYKIRNDNPVEHASSGMLYENNTTILELNDYIRFLNALLLKVKKFIIDNGGTNLIDN